MKIRQPDERRKRFVPAGGGAGGTGTAVSVRTDSFHSTLSNAQHHLMEEELRLLLEVITEQGQQLSRQTKLFDLLKYKRSVSEFLDKALQSMLTLKKNDYIDRCGRHHMYGLIQKVNAKLETLTQEVLRHQEDHLKSLSLVDEIRGLLVDLLL